jgi:histidyl-tRNA synthetase
MKDVNTRVLPGFMELLPKEQIEFNKIKQIIAEEYQKFGFTPIDTPVIERLEILLAKAGGETEKQIYRFNKGDNDLSLRFDLTVPLARYVADHYNDLTFPFKRSHIGKVYRGESPQRGRFREFYQCDIDVIGHNDLSINYDAEIPVVIYSIFSRLNFGKFTIKLNNRKILAGLMNSLGLIDQSKDVLRVIDKSSKISQSEIVEEFKKLGLNDDQIKLLTDFTAISGKASVAIDALKNMAIADDEFVAGVDDLKLVTELMKSMGIDEDYYAIDLSIARGLDYYTGTIYETTLDQYPELGSVCGGGRYDDLASYYTDEKLPGVGISIGLTRLFFQLSEAGLINASEGRVADVLVMPLSQEQVVSAFEIAQSIRGNGINTDVLLDDIQMKKRFKYADKKGFKYVVIVGENEVVSSEYVIQNMESGDKENIAIDKIVEYLKNKLN